VRGELLRQPSGGPSLLGSCCFVSIIFIVYFCTAGSLLFLVRTDILVANTSASCVEAKNNRDLHGHIRSGLKASSSITGFTPSGVKV
jgi:hypothetical protein